MKINCFDYVLFHFLIPFSEKNISCNVRTICFTKYIVVFHWLVVFLKKKILRNIRTSFFHEEIFLLKVRTNLVCFLMIMFAADVQECILIFIFPVIENIAKKICIIVGQKYEFPLPYVSILVPTKIFVQIRASYMWNMSI